MKEIEVELIDSMGGDLSIVNSARTSFAKWKDDMDDKDEKLVSYLGKHKHITPFRHNCLQFRCTAPIFIARQLMKHQAGLTWNEMSFRYMDEPVGYYIPETWRSRPDGSIKQGSGEDNVEWINRETRTGALYREALDKCVDTYETMLDAGVAPEMARMVLPQSMLVTWIRACKSLNPNTRLKSMYKRFYIDLGEEESKMAISSILTSIIDEFAPMSLGDYKHSIAQQRSYYLWSKDSPDDLQLDVEVLLYHLRFLNKDKLNSLGYIKPSRWRR